MPVYSWSYSFTQEGTLFIYIYAIVVQFHSRGTVACVSMATLPAGKLIVVAFQYLVTHTDTCVCVNTCLLC